jgi:competence protein ComEA
LLLLGVTIFASLGLAQDFPSGPGRETMLKVCTACHGLESIPNLRYSKVEWQDLVFSMADKGADATGDELDEIVAYLTKNYGKPTPKLNINKATDADLVSSLQLTPKDAVAIVAYRKAHGNFKSADDLAKVDGFDSKKVDAIKDRIDF